MSGYRDESGYRHMMRVRLGQHGATGSLRHCEKKDKSGWYWRVKLDGGQFTWPADIHIDGKGDLVSRCRDCGLPFITATVGEPLCCYCDESAHGTKQRAQEPSDYHGLAPRGPARRSI
jgi:hypothetical protein